MKKLINRIVLLTMLVLFVSTTIAQGQLTGTVVDSETNEALVGANIIVKGTTNGTIANAEGKFSITVSSITGSVNVSFIGYESKVINFNTSVKSDLGIIVLVLDATSLKDVVVIGSGVIDLTEDRITPIASSAITRAEIQSKAIGNVEFPEIMKNTPSVYVSNQSGGFGDSQMFVRGFDQRNTAFLLNGQPINGMEDGKMYWSNWAGMSDIASAIQVQRGLGSSKLAISSVGGTVNIVTKTTDMKKGGFARAMTGNDGYIKGTAAYNTGINDNGWGFSIMLDYWQGENKWAKGTKGAGQNYFFSVGKIAGDHKFNFLLVGAPQWHGQNYTKSQSNYDNYGIKYNSNWGVLEGDFYTLRKNYYHKPILNLNWDWDLSTQSKLSTVLYASLGRGGGTGNFGTSPRYITGGVNEDDGLINWDNIVTYNETITDGIGVGYNGLAMRSSVNNHLWYGMVTNYEYDTQNNLKFNIGTDIRFYKGDHFRQLVDLLGLSGFTTTMMGDTHVVSATYGANPWASLFNYANQEDRIYYDYSENLNYQGVFGQAEYANNALSAFFQAAVSNQSYKREDRTNFVDVKESKTVNKIGYNLKGGASFMFADNNSVFVNSGIYSRQPFLDNVFPSYTDYTEQANPEVDNEQIIGIEAGYKYATSNFSLNFNGYYTTWKNRFYDEFGTDDNGVSFRTMFTNIAENHKGLELDMRYKPISAWMLRGYSTIGDWKYNGTTPYKKINTDTNTTIAEGDVDLTGTKIGSAPQFTFGLGTSYDIIANKLSVDADFNYAGKFYGYVNEDDAVTASVAGEEYQPEKLNTFGLLDMGASYRMPLDDNNLVFRANVYNVLNKEYVSQQDSYGILYGAGTTWNFSVKYVF